MLRIDHYGQHILKHNADLLTLASGEPAKFTIGGSERKTATPIEHAQLVQLVQEAAPPSAVDELKRKGNARFTHEGEVVLDVAVEVRGPGAWLVMLTRGLAKPKGLGLELDERALPNRAAHAAAAAFPAHTANAPALESAARPASPAIEPPSVASLRRPPSAQRQPAVPAPLAPPPAAHAPVVSPDGEPRINYFLRQMMKVGASDLHISSEVVPMLRLHGEMAEMKGERAHESDELRRILEEIMPARNKTELEERNDTDFAHMIVGLARFRVNVFVDRKGVGAVFRQIPFEILSVAKLGLPEKVLDLCWLTKGLVLVTGPTGSGKSTTLASLIGFINENRSDHIITIEDPIEFVHENKKCLVNQREIVTHTSGFKSALRAALREDPDIVLVGEMRDLETIAIAIETAETGHLVFGTLHTSSAASTVDRIIDQFPADRQEQIRVMLSESLRGVIAQVLCKKKGGGRVAAHEILIATPAVSNLIREGKTFQLKSVMQTGRALGMQLMNDHLLRLVKDGTVEPAEAYMKSNDKHDFKEMLKRENIVLQVGGS